MNSKDALKQYRTAALNAADEIKRVRSIYKESEADRLENGIRERLSAKKAEAVSVFDAEIADGNRRAEEWARLDGSKITSDAKLLDFDLSPAEYGELVERYKENGTMSRLLFAYGEKRNQARAEKHPGEATSPFDEGYFDTSTVPTKESKSREYAGDAIKAKSLADLMTLDRGYMRGVDSEMVNAEYSAFMGE